MPLVVRQGSEEPPAISRLGPANICRAELDSRWDRVAHSSKVSERFDEGLDVDILSEDVGGADLSDDSEHLRPEVSVVFDSLASQGMSSLTEGLAWEASTDHVYLAPPWGWVERLDVRVDRELRQRPVGLTSSQDALAVWVHLHGADGGVPQQIACQDTTAHASKEVELPHA